MRLYTTTGAAQVDDPEYGTFKAGANGAFDGLPDGMYAKLHGRPGWENDPERELRVAREELDKFRDPAELLKAVKELGANQGMLATALASALGLAPATAPALPTVADTPPPATVTAPPAPAAPDVKPTGRKGAKAAPDAVPTPAP
jgi:hypothetical protein